MDASLKSELHPSQAYTPSLQSFILLCNPPPFSAILSSIVAVIHPYRPGLQENRRIF